MLDPVPRFVTARLAWVKRNGRAVAIGAGVAVALFVAGLVAGFHLDEESRVPVARFAREPIHGETARRLADQFRPVLRFSQERWRPLNIDAFLEEEGAAGPHRLCTSGGLCRPVGGREGLEREAAAYLDLAGERRNGVDAHAPALPGCPRPDIDWSAPVGTPAVRVVNCDAGAPSSIYYRVTKANDRFYVDYWWFFRYNDYPVDTDRVPCRVQGLQLCADHEGDWEGITVVTQGTETLRIRAVGFAQHKGIVRVSAGRTGALGVRRDRLEIQREHGPDYDYERPVVYVASGTHASYPTGRCRGRCQIPGTPAPEGTHDGAISWERNPRAECEAGPVPCLLELPASNEDGTTPWTLWAGQWGVRPTAARLDEGPRSPGLQPRYREPDCYGTPLKIDACDSPESPE